MHIYRDDIPVYVLGALLALLVLSVIVVSIAMARADSRCLALGYPTGMVDWRLRPYCAARINQTDVVVPLDQAPSRVGEPR